MVSGTYLVLLFTSLICPTSRGTATLGCLERIEDSGSIGPEANGTHQTLMNLDKQISERREVELCSHSTATSVCHRFAMNR